MTRATDRDFAFSKRRMAVEQKVIDRFLKMISQKKRKHC